MCYINDWSSDIHLFDTGSRNIYVRMDKLGKLTEKFPYKVQIDGLNTKTLDLMRFSFHFEQIQKFARAWMYHVGLNCRDVKKTTHNGIDIDRVAIDLVIWNPLYSVYYTTILSPPTYFVSVKMNIEISMLFLFVLTWFLIKSLCQISTIGRCLLWKPVRLLFQTKMHWRTFPRSALIWKYWK